MKKLWPQSKLPDVVGTYCVYSLAWFILSTLLCKMFDVGEW